MNLDRLASGSTRPKRRFNREPLAMAVALAVVWCVWLAVFYPGLMTSDSVDQWIQATTGRMNDWHPVFHTWCLGLVRWFWPSPAAVALLQIGAYAGLCGWGAYLLLARGAPRAAVWISIGILALSPVTGTMVIALWKDVAFAAASLWVTLLVLEASQEPAAASGLRFWRALVIAGVLCALWRHNGIALVLGAYAALVLLDRARWRAALLSLGATVGIAAAVHGAVMRAHAVRPGPPPALAWVGLLAANVSHGTPLSSRERALLSSVHPLDDGWKYDCITTPVVFDGRFHMEAVQGHQRELSALALSLATRRPSLTLGHQACITSLLWKPSQGTDPMSGPAIGFGPADDLTTIYPMPGAPQAHSLLPGLRRLVGRILRSTLDPRWTWLWWRPALPLYALLCSCGLACWRLRSWAPAAVLGPVLSHTAVLLLLIPAPDVRYQYPIFLTAWLLVPAWLAAPSTRVAGERSARETALKAGLTPARPAGYKARKTEENT